MWFIQGENPLGPYSVPACIFCLDCSTHRKLGAADWRQEAVFMKKKGNLRQTH